MRKSSLILVSALIVLLSFSLSLSAAGQAEGNTSGEKVVTLALEQEPTGLNPVLIPDQVAISVCDSIFDNLITFLETVSTPEPALAESWDISDDGLVYTFYLRKGVKFHNGTELTAKDVKFTMDNILDDANASPQKAFISMVNDVSIIDDYTVRFTLNAPFGAFMLNLGSEGNMGILPADYAQEVGMEEFSRHPIGTGPFKFASWSADDRIVLERNDDYWRVRPNLDKVVFRFIPKAETVAAELQAGGIDVATTLSPQDIERLGNMADTSIMDSEMAMTLRYIGFNDHRAPYNDVRFRKAVYQAVDMDKLVEVIFGDTGFRAYSWIPVGVFGDDVDYMKSRALSYNPDEATRLFDELKADGVIDDDFVLTIKTNQDPFRVKVATAVVSELQKYGITAKVESLEWGTLVDQLTGEEGVDCYVMSWHSVPDPDRWLFKPFHSGQSMNFSKLADPEIDALLEQGRSTTDLEARTEIYTQIMRDVLGERYLHIPLVWLTNRYVYNNRLSGLSSNYPWLFVTSKRNVDIIAE